jgi:tripartite-type tricarboxylate transporter receptor subunit TctC
LCAPAGLPKDVLAKISAESFKALNAPDTRQRLTEQGVDTRPMTPEQFTSYIRSEIAKWAKVAKAAGIVLE